MITRIGILAAAVAALLAWDRSLAGSAAAERASRERVGRLLSSERRDAMPVAALIVELGTGERFVYARAGGIWRCIDHHAAPADPEAVEGVVGKLSTAEGRIQTTDLGRADVYGIGTRETVRVSFAGPNVLADPKGDVLWTVEVGRSADGGEASFVRPLDAAERSGAIWRVDVNPRVELEARPAPHLPPLLDPSVVSKSWPGLRAGLASVRVERAGAEPLDLAREAVEVTPDELRSGAPPWQWVASVGGSPPAPADMGLASTYLAFLVRAPYADVLDPERAAELLADRRGTVTLTATDGARLSLAVGAPAPDGRVPVRNSFTRALHLVEPEIAQLLLPSPSMLASGAGSNPWEPHLRHH